MSTCLHQTAWTLPWLGQRYLGCVDITGPEATRDEAFETEIVARDEIHQLNPVVRTPTIQTI
jgi:hypothetical protein